MARHYFVDETKAKGYLLVAVRVDSARLAEIRQAVVQLVMPGQRSIHMKNEGDRRRRMIADSVARLPVDVHVLDASRGAGREHERRERCVRALLLDVEPSDRVVFDRDTTMERFDRRFMAAAPAERRPSFCHTSRHEEPLLALPDVIAWSWARGAEWRRRLSAVEIVRRDV